MEIFWPALLQKISLARWCQGKSPQVIYTETLQNIIRQWKTH